MSVLLWRTSELMVKLRSKNFANIFDNILVFSAHKLILSARSDYFRAMLFGGLSESTSSEIKLDSVPVNAFKIVLR